MKTASLALLLLVIAVLLSGCGRVCIAGIGDCSGLGNSGKDLNQGGALVVKFDPRSISVNGTSTLTGTGGRIPCSFKLVAGAGICQLDAYSATNCTAVVRGLARGPCMMDVTDADGIVKSDTLTISGR